MTWVTAHPPQRADLDLCVTCGLCLPVCPTYRLTGDETASPRGRLAAIDAVETGAAPLDKRFGEIVSFCLQCRACETACPSLVPFGAIIESATAEVQAQMPAAGSRLRRFALTTVLSSPTLLRSGSIAIGVAQRIGIPSMGLRRIPLPQRSARGQTWGEDATRTAVLFLGCVADAWFSDIHKATIEVLVAAGYRVEAPSSQTCCGALAAHDGHAEDARTMADTNRAVFADADVIVVNVAGCGAHLKADGEFGDRVRDITEIAAEAIAGGALPVMESHGERVAIQDPCHLEHGQGIMEEPRTVLRAAGYDVVDVDRGGLCCGAAGMYLVDHPDTSADLGNRKADAVRATNVKIVASANAGCEMQLRRYLDAGFEIKHPIELYAAQL